MERNYDHLTNLPDNMITLIFSYLTMREALAICISCKKLMHLRNTIPHLEFKESADDSFNLLVDTKKRKLVQVINRFLKNRDYPIQTFRLLFYPGWYSDDVFNWISIVMQKGLIELDIDFLSNLGVPIQLPSSLLNSNTLQALKLRSCGLESLVGLGNLSSLKSLLLSDVTLSDDAIDTLLCQSRLLQRLSLENCKGFESIKITDINSELDYLFLENCHGLDFLFAPQVRVLSTICTGECSICTGKTSVFVIEASLITGVSFFPKSTVTLSKEKALHRTSRVLDNMKFSADGELEDDLLNLEYLGVAKLELKTCSWHLGVLHGHTWLLRNAFVDKVVLSMFHD